MRKLFAVVLLVSVPLLANETSVHTLQSGSTFGPTPLFDHGLHGEGQIIAVLDTGVDWDNCFFAEADGSAPPYNLRVTDTAVNPSRRKIIAYDFLYSCAAFPNASGCDDPSNPKAFDNQGHGTHAAASAAADRGTPIAHDYGDAIAAGAKLIVQDAGYTGGDNCSQRPGIGCPVNLTPILAQAYAQGARIHSNSWGDAQGNAFAPATANYSQSARDVDAFVYDHPDMLVVFNTGNYGANATPPPSTLSAPGCAKNTLQVGGTRTLQRPEDDTIALYSLVGPTRDGRLKPDVVGPAQVIAGDSDGNVGTHNCDLSNQSGTSWASPTIAGAAALVRQYYTDGFYPSGAATAADRFMPSAALLKATIIAAARPVPYISTPTGGFLNAAPAPNATQGFGFPVLGDVLYFPGNAARLRVADVASGLAQGETASTAIAVRAGTPLKVVLVWTDPPGVVRGTSDPTPELVNDLDLRVVDAAGHAIVGNDALHPGQPDRLNNVEVVSIANPPAGNYAVSVSANRIGSGAPQNYALVISGDVADAAKVRHRAAAR
jgi:Subtilase family